MLYTCASCGTSVDLTKDAFDIDDDAWIYCTTKCKRRGVNAGRFFGEIEKSLTGKKYTKAYFKLFNELYYRTNYKKIVYISIKLFKELKYDDGQEIVEKSKAILKTIARTKWVTDKQRNCLCHFIAKTTLGEIKMDMKKISV